MWNGPGWGPMHGWWIMPFLVVICLALLLFILSRLFGSGGFCGRPPTDRDSGIEELKKEIEAMRQEIRELKEKNKKAD